MVFKRYKTADGSSAGIAKHRVKPSVIDNPQYNSVLGSVDIYKHESQGKKKKKRETKLKKKGRKDDSSSSLPAIWKAGRRTSAVKASSSSSATTTATDKPQGSTASPSSSKVTSGSKSKSKGSSSAASSTGEPSTVDPEIFRASHSELKRRIREKIEEKVEQQMAEPRLQHDHWGKYVGSDSDEWSKYSMDKSNLFATGSKSDSDGAKSGAPDGLEMDKWSEHGDEGESKTLRYGTAQLRGIRRTQQDAFLIQEKFTIKKQPAALFGVFDGHATDKVSEMCKKHFPKLLTKACKGSTYKALKPGLEKAYGDFVRVVQDAKIDGEEKDMPSTTATVAVVTKKEVVVASIGDTRAVLCVDGKAVSLSRDTDDTPLTVPGVMKHARKGAEFLLLVSDGVADVLSDEELVEMVRIKVQREVGLELLCKTLLGLAFSLGSLDNMTIVLVVFKKR